MKFIIPKNYVNALSLKDTEIAIKAVKDTFERRLAQTLNLTRVSAPLFVFPESGLNDNLNGIERPVTFGIKEQNDKEAEIIHSLAKWKRSALARYGFEINEGIYTDMNAIRRDEEADNIHSIYVDQWDWELIIDKQDRTLTYLKEVVSKIFDVLKETEKMICAKFHFEQLLLPEQIAFITTQEALDMFPNTTPKEREYLLAKKYGAYFLMQIGGKLRDGASHDGRAPDYDDWSLNGDIIVYYPVLDISLELSSMGIRVDAQAMNNQLNLANANDRREFTFHKAILNNTLPLTIGGGIGQSRICMFYLRKAHIGEVQASLWPIEMIEECAKHNITLL